MPNCDRDCTILRVSANVQGTGVYWFISGVKRLKYEKNCKFKS